MNKIQQNKTNLVDSTINQMFQHVPKRFETKPVALTEDRIEVKINLKTNDNEAGAWGFMKFYGQVNTFLIQMSGYHKINLDETYLSKTAGILTIRFSF